MKQINQFINEYIVKKKLDKFVDSEDHYEYFPKTKEELIKNIEECLDSKNYNLNCIDTSKIIDMSNLFDSGNYNKSLNNIDISKWDVSNVKYMQFMFDNCTDFEGKGLENWDVSNVEITKYMFYNCENFNCDLSNWDVSSVTNMERTFYGCEIFEGKGLENWNVSNVTNMCNMFQCCENFTGKGLDKWNVSNVKYTKYMFFECTNFDCDLSNWDVSKVENMSNMFYNCNLKNTPAWYVK